MQYTIWVIYRDVCLEDLIQTTDPDVSHVILLYQCYFLLPTLKRSNIVLIT